MSDPDNSVQFAYKIDSVGNVFVKVFTFSGFKVFDGIITKDSIISKYLIDDSYSAFLQSLFRKYNSKVCLNRLVIDILSCSLTSNKFCYISEIDSVSKNLKFNIFGTDYSKILDVEYGKKHKSLKLSSKPSCLFLNFGSGSVYKIDFKK